MSAADTACFREIYPRARRFAAFVAPAGVEPDDLVQEALARVLAKHSLTELSEPLAYLRTTMLNLVRNEHRRVGRERSALVRLGPARGVDDGDAVARSGESDDLVGALQGLPAQAAAAVFLVDVEGYAIAEAAALVGLSVVATRARLSRARRALRDQISNREEIAR